MALASTIFLLALGLVPLSWGLRFCEYSSDVELATIVGLGPAQELQQDCGLKLGSRDDVFSCMILIPLILYNTQAFLNTFGFLQRGHIVVRKVPFFRPLRRDSVLACFGCEYSDHEEDGNQDPECSPNHVLKILYKDEQDQKMCAQLVNCVIQSLSYILTESDCKEKREQNRRKET